MADPTASLEAHCFLGVKNIITEMARENVFKSRGTNSTDRVRPEAVVGQFGKSPVPKGPLPGFIVTYLGHKRSMTEGENDSDLGTLSILVQLIDKIPNEDARDANTYFTWMAAVRKWILDGPLEDPDETLGFVWQTHVSDQMPPREYSWAISDKMQMMLTITCNTKTRRSIDKAQA